MMIKQFLNVIMSPIFVITFVISIMVLLFNYIHFENDTEKYEPKYVIEYYENANEYDVLIKMYEEKIEELTEKDKDYDELKNYFCNKIKIYESLKDNNINYKFVYDNGYGDNNDQFIFIYKSQTVLMLIMFVNLLVILFITFTTEFDNSRYIFVYQNYREKVLIKKIVLSIILNILLFLIYYLINYIFSLKLYSEFDYFLIIDNQAHFISISSYLLHYHFFLIFYNLMFISFIIWSIALFTKKTSYTLISILFLFIVCIPLYAFNFNLFNYIGLAIDFNVIPYDLSLYLRFLIIIPFTILIISFICFLKKDL